MLASPDIDVDVFRRQIAEIDVKPRTTQFHAVCAARRQGAGLVEFPGARFDLARQARSHRSTYSSMLEKAQVNVIDLTGVASNDVANHSKFATSEVVTAIGERLAKGQTLTEANPGVCGVARFVYEGHVRCRRGRGDRAQPIVDPTLSEKSVDTAAGSVTLEQ